MRCSIFSNFFNSASLVSPSLAHAMLPLAPTSRLLPEAPLARNGASMEGYHSSPGSPMPMAAGHLGPNEIEALASYLSFVR
jgi:hypothetical protein